MNSTDLNHMSCLDIFFSATDRSKYAQLSSRMKLVKNHFPLLALDLIALENEPFLEMAQRKRDFLLLQEFYRKFKWKTDLQAILKNDYEALVLTDFSETIAWVNSGFENMTGFQPDEAIGKSPKFLQGEETSADSRSEIRTKLSQNNPFSKTIVNYRKNGEKYRCHLDIFPLQNAKNRTTHFIALEREVA